MFYLGIEMKIGVIGTGNVGASIAYSILQNKNIEFDKFVLNDIIEKVHGIRLDFCHAFPDRSDKIIVGDYNELNDCDVVVITAGITMIRGSKGMVRMELLEKNKKIFESIFQKLKPKSDAVIIVVTNPSDAMAHVALRLSRLKPNQVIGFGNQLDTARYRFALSQILNVSPTSIEGYVIGQHGEEMIPVFSQTKVDEKQLDGSVDKIAIKNKVKDAARDVIKLTGCTQYGPGQAVSELVEAVVKDQKRTLPVSTLLNGEHDVQGMYMGVPCVIGKNGVEKIIELELDEDEKTQFLSLAEKSKQIQK